MYGTVKHVLLHDEYTIRWDDQAMPDSNHFYHKSMLGCICRIDGNEGLPADYSTAPRGPGPTDDAPGSHSDSEDEADEPGD